MKLFQIILFILLCVVLSSCMSQFIFHDDLNTIEKGQNINIMRDQIESSPEYSFSFENNGSIFCCDIYDLVYNKYTYVYSGTNKTRTKYYTKSFCMLYKDDTFHYCFSVDDINKEEDTLTRRIAPIFITKYLEIINN